MASMKYIFLFVSLLGVFELDLCQAKGVLYYQEPENDGSVCSGQSNKNWPWSGSPTLVREVTNGSLYTAGEGDDQIYGTQVLKW